MAIFTYNRTARNRERAPMKKMILWTIVAIIGIAAFAGPRGRPTDIHKAARDDSARRYAQQQWRQELRDASHDFRQVVRDLNRR
jgi:hypothetical protein